MRKVVALLSLCLLSFSVRAVDGIDSFLAADAALEATRSFDSGDRRHLVVPVCVSQPSEVLPGWPSRGPTPPEFWTALEQARRPFQCDDLGEDAKGDRFMRLLKYAEQYNGTLLELGRKNAARPDAARPGI